MDKKFEDLGVEFKNINFGDFEEKSPKEIVAEQKVKAANSRAQEKADRYQAQLREEQEKAEKAAEVIKRIMSQPAPDPDAVQSYKTDVYFSKYAEEPQEVYEELPEEEYYEEDYPEYEEEPVAPRRQRRKRKHSLFDNARDGYASTFQKVIAIILAVLILIFGSLFVVFSHYVGMLSEFDNGDSTALVANKDQSEADKKTFNILLVGVDSRKNTYTGRSDTMIILSINKSSKKVVMTSLLRDSYVAIPGHGYNKLNAAFAKGGTKLLTQTIYDNYHIAIDRTAVINFMFVVDLIDAVGGVEINVKQPELQYLNMYTYDQNWEVFGMKNNLNKDRISSPGTYNLNGNQALGYARIRYVGSDFGRTERQRIVLGKVMEKAEDMSVSELSDLANEFLPRVRTDLSQTDIASLLTTLLRAKNYEIKSMALPVEGTYASGTVGNMSVLKVNFEANTRAWEEAISG